MDILLITKGVKDIRNITPYQHSKLLVDEYNTTIVSSSKVAPNIEEKSENTFCYQDWHGKDFLFPYWATLFSFYYYFLSGYDVIYTTRSSQCIFTGVLSLILDIEWVADIWDYPRLTRQINRYNTNRQNKIIPKRPYSAVFSAISLKILNYSDSIILSISPNICSDLDINMEEKNIIQVTNGVDVEYTRSIANNYDKKNPKAEEKIKIIYVGSVRKSRGADVILEAAKLLQKNMDRDFEIKIVGEISNDNRQWIENKVRTYDLKNCLNFTGVLSHTDAINEINTSDICINLLDSEVKNYDYAYPIKIFEYMALGKAIISTKTTGVEEILVDKETSILLEENNPKKVAEYIQTLSNNPQYRRYLGRNAKRNAEKFDWYYIRNKINDELYHFLTESGKTTT